MLAPFLASSEHFEGLKSPTASVVESFRVWGPLGFGSFRVKGLRFRALGLGAFVV